MKLILVAVWSHTKGLGLALPFAEPWAGNSFLLPVFILFIHDAFSSISLWITHVRLCSS